MENVINDLKNKEESYKLTCVSAFWKVKNKHGDSYIDWFHNTLKINCPYVFFGDKESITIVKKYRGVLPTYYIECNFEDFTTYKFKDKMMTHTVHCPSIELNLIWNEKVFFVKKALDINPFNSEYFCWIDAGICTYRQKSPPVESFHNENMLSSVTHENRHGESKRNQSLLYDYLKTLRIPSFCE